MCIICIEIDKDKLKFKEAIRNLREMYHSIEYSHHDEVIKKVLELESKELKKPVEAVKDENNL